MKGKLTYSKSMIPIVGHSQDLWEELKWYSTI